MPALMESKLETGRSGTFSEPPQLSMWAGVVTYQNAVFGQLTRLHALEIPITGADSTIQRQHGPIIMAAILGTSGCGVRIATGGILCDRQDHVALPDH